MMQSSFKLSDDDRGVNSTISYVLFTAILAVLITTVIGGVGAYGDAQQTTIVRDSLDTIGDDTANTLMEVDQVAANEYTTIMYRTRSPERVAGTGYTITLFEQNGAQYIRLDGDNTDVVVKKRIVTTHPIDTEAAVKGGTLYIVVEDGILTIKPPDEVDA